MKNVNEVNDKNETPLYVAITCELDVETKKKIMKELILKKVDMNQIVKGFSPLWYAFEMEKLELIKYLKDNKAELGESKINLPLFVKQINQGNKEMIEEILKTQGHGINLEKGFFPDGIKRISYLELVLKSEHPDVKIVKLLVSKGVKVEKKHIEYAMEKNLYEIYKFLDVHQ